MKDYYKILGAEEEASEKEIRARWIELTKRYHPDLAKTKEADKKIKEINEAYEILGNESTRFKYDFERDLKRSLIKNVQSRKERRMNIQKIILPLGIFALFLIAGVVIFRWVHVTTPPKPEAHYEGDKVSEQETASQIPPVETNSKIQADMKAPKEIREEVMPQESKEMASVSPQASPSGVELESKKKEESADKILPKSEVPVKAEEQVLAKEEPKPVKELVPQVAMKSEMPAMKEVPKEVQKKVTGDTLHPGEKLTITTKEGKKVPKEIRKVVPRESALIDKPNSAAIEPQPVQKPETSVKAGKVVFLPPSPLAKEEEVTQFFSNYIDRYNQKDIDGFLSFFSSNAIQNQKDGLKEIRNIYSKFFDQSQELRYQVEGMEMGVYQNAVEVKARFRVDQRLKKPREEKTWKGNIRWVLVREDGVFKISSLDYQNEKSP
jgi:curved DNA-binding protein